MALTRHTLVLQVDGTPGALQRGIAGLGIVVRGPWGQVLTSRCLRAPAKTNNEAEYQALIKGLEFMLKRYPEVAVRCLSDSQVVVDQVLGRCRVHSGALKPLYEQAAVLVRQFTTLELLLIPRELNRLADALAWEALSGRQAIVRFGR